MDIDYLILKVLIYILSGGHTSLFKGHSFWKSKTLIFTGKLVNNTVPITMYKNWHERGQLIDHSIDVRQTSMKLVIPYILFHEKN